MNIFSGKCPICGEKMVITKFRCQHCHTTLEGRFSVSKISELTEKQQEFAELFIKCRGNLKELGKELDLSYPTVRNRLDDIITALGYEVDDTITEEDQDDEEEQKISILNSIENGNLSVDDAIQQIKQIKKEK